MAMAIRCALAKQLASNKNRSGLVMLIRAFASSSTNRNRNHPKDAVAGHYFRHRFDYKDYKSKAQLPKVYDYYMDLGGLEPARFAMEEYNKQRNNAQLQLVRVVKSERHLLETGISSLYFITMEAVDHAGVAKLYQARVSVNFTQGMILEWFCLLVDDGCPIALFDHLEKFFVLKDNVDKADNQIPMCKRLGSDCVKNSCNKLVYMRAAYDLQDNGKMLKKIGHWAVKNYNKEKNDTLQFMRVVSGTRCWPAGFVFLTLEAADAGVMKTYQAELFLPVASEINLPCSRLHLFGHVDDNGSLSILIDKRHERITEESESDEEEMAEEDFCRYKDTFFPCTALPSCF